MAEKPGYYWCDYEFLRIVEVIEDEEGLFFMEYDCDYNDDKFWGRKVYINEIGTEVRFEKVEGPKTI